MQLVTKGESDSGVTEVPEAWQRCWNQESCLTACNVSLQMYIYAKCLGKVGLLQLRDNGAFNSAICGAQLVAYLR